MNIKTIGAAVVGAAAIGLSVSSVAPAEAATLDFNFSFTDVSNGNAVVTGVVRGLTDNSISSATSLRVLTNTAGFGIGEYIGGAIFNSWLVSGGTIQAVDFAAVGVGNLPPGVTDSSIILSANVFSSIPFAGLNNSPFSTGGAENPSLTFTPATPIPAPALLPGLLGLGIAALRKRKSELSEEVAEPAEV